MMLDWDSIFPRYRDFAPMVPVWCATPSCGGCFHRFFDTSPISPGGRWLALSRLRREDRMPLPGDPAEVVLVDLRDGRTTVVAESRAWDTQLGAQVQWGGNRAASSAEQMSGSVKGTVEND